MFFFNFTLFFNETPLISIRSFINLGYLLYNFINVIFADKYKLLYTTIIKPYTLYLVNNIKVGLITKTYIVIYLIKLFNKLNVILSLL